MNIFVRANDAKAGIWKGILDKVDREVGIERGVIIDRSRGGATNYGKKYTVISYNEFAKYPNFNKFFNMEELLPLSRDVLEKAAEYEGMMMEMCIRYCEFPVINLAEAKEQMLAYLRFWNHIIKKYKIDYMFFSLIPHAAVDFPVYVLGKIYNISMTLLYPTAVGDYAFYGGDINDLGKNAAADYELILSNKLELTLNEDFSKYIDKQINSNEVKEKRHMKDLIEEADRLNAKRFIMLKNVKCRIGYKLKEIKAAKTSENKRREKYSCLELKYDIKLLIKSYFYVMVAIHTRKITPARCIKKIDYQNEKYICILLHSTPEASLLPNCGVFREQLEAIRIVALAARRCNIKVFVKEHGVQYVRSGSFYDAIYNMPNTYFVDREIPTRELMNHSTAVVTMAGSCIWECMARKIPVIVAKEGPWSNVDYVNVIYDMKSVAKFLNNIINNKIELTDFKRDAFFMAVQRNSVKLPIYFVSEDRSINKYIIDKVADFMVGQCKLL